MVLGAEFPAALEHVHLHKMQNQANTQM